MLNRSLFTISSNVCFKVHLAKASFPQGHLPVLGVALMELLPMSHRLQLLLTGSRLHAYLISLLSQERGKREGRAMRIVALALLFAVTIVLGAGCQDYQQERINQAQHDSLYGAPRNVSWDVLTYDKGSYHIEGP
jgi:hypothetical protein